MSFPFTFCLPLYSLPFSISSLILHVLESRFPAHTLTSSLLMAYVSTPLFSFPSLPGPPSFPQSSFSCFFIPFLSRLPFLFCVPFSAMKSVLFHYFTFYLFHVVFSFRSIPCCFPFPFCPAFPPHLFSFFPSFYLILVPFCWDIYGTVGADFIGLYRL